MAGKGMEWQNVLLVVLGLLVLLVAPGMPLNSLVVPHVYAHYLVGVVLLVLGLWNWFGKK